MKLIYHPAVEAEVVAAATFYEQRVNGLGRQFLDEFDRSVEVILTSPERWRILKADKRRYLMVRFPYAIYFRIFEEEVRVLVVKHHSQHPDYTMNRE